MERDLDYKLPCLGTPLEGNYGCEVACKDREECYVVMVRDMLKGEGLAELPEFLVHPNHHVRKGACSLVEQLRRK